MKNPWYRKPNWTYSLCVLANGPALFLKTSCAHPTILTPTLTTLMFSFSDVRAFFFLIDLRSFFCTLLSSVTVSTTSSVTAVAPDDDNDDVDSCWTVVDDDEVTLVTVVLVSIVFWTLPSLVMILKGN